MLPEQKTMRYVLEWLVSKRIVRTLLKCDMVQIQFRHTHKNQTYKKCIEYIIIVKLI